MATQRSARDSARGGPSSHRGGGPHNDLFQPLPSNRAGSSPHHAPLDQHQGGELIDDYTPSVLDQQIHDTYGAGDYQEDPLQLEHVVGFGAESISNLCALPLNEYVIAKGMGNFITIENINDPHDQKFLRAHDMPVTVLAVSPSGELLASGQVGTTRYKGNAAPVFVWSTVTGRRMAALRGITQRVNLLQFSTDEKFLCGCGDDCLLYVWELATGEVVYVQRFTYPVCIMTWIAHSVESRRTVYDLALGVGTTLSKGKFYFDQGRVQWTLSLKPYALPSGGLVRQFASVVASDDCQFLFVGSTGSDLIVYRHDIAVYRALIPVCSNGVRSIAKLSNGDLLCGGGDGTLTKIRGEDLMWEVIQRIQLSGSIFSLSLSSSQAEVVIGCSTGSIYRCMVQSLTPQLVAAAHTSPISCIKFGSSDTLRSGEEKVSSSEDDRTGFFVTGTYSGELRVWDIADYTCLGFYKETKTHSTSALGVSGGGNSVQSVAFYGANNSHVISGWKDGSVKCMDVTLQRVVWTIPQAHRDGVTTIAICSSSALSAGPKPRGPPSSSGRGNGSGARGPSVEYMVTGGKDGAIRIWKLSTRELVTQYTEHTKSISRVLVDLQSSHIIHSSSYDGTVISYDLQTNQRKISHILSSSGGGSGRPGGSGGNGGSISLTDMTQRFDSEGEVVTCDTGGRLITWDIDIRDPVMIVQDISEVNPSLTCCMISPVTGLYLAFAGSDGVLKILDIRRNQIISLGRGHSDEIVSLSWTPDEKQIITGGKDNCMCVWNYYLGGG